MKAARIRNNNKKEEIKKVEDNYSLKKMILIVVIVAVTFVVFYLITDLVVDPVKETNEENITDIDSSKITVSQLLDRKEEEYYVLATKSLEAPSGHSMINYKEIYESYIKDYNSVLDAFKFYEIDLDDALNKVYNSDELNITENLEELKLNDDVLFKINKGKIEEYYVGNNEIIEILSTLKES